MIHMRVYGEPAPQGSKRFVGNGRMIESSKKVGPWREAIVSEAIRSGHANALMDGALDVELRFLLARPAGHFGKRGLLPSAPEWPKVKPDLDKLIRSTLDGLTQCGVIADDARVVGCQAVKAYVQTDETPGALIVLSERK